MSLRRPRCLLQAASQVETRLPRPAPPRQGGREGHNWRQDSRGPVLILLEPNMPHTRQLRLRYHLTTSRGLGYPPRSQTLPWL